MSFNTARKAPLSEAEETAALPPEVEAAIASSGSGTTSADVPSAEAMVEAVSPPAETAAATPAAEAPTSFDDELGAVAVARDINAEPVEPPTRTEAEIEKAGEPVAGDPLLPGELPPEAVAADAPSADPVAGDAAAGGSAEGQGEAQAETEAGAEAAAEAGTEPEPFKIDEDELRSFGLDKPTIDAIVGLSAERARDVIAEIRTKNSFVNDLEKKKGEIENGIRARKQSSSGGPGLFGAVAKLFEGPSPEQQALKRTAGDLDQTKDYLGNDNIRARVHKLRRQEIVEAANSLSIDNRRLSAASQAFNAAVLSTPAGQAFEAEVASIAERHPGMSRNDIISAAKTGTLAARIGEDTLSPHVQEIFKDDRVKAAWKRVSTAADAIEAHGETLLTRMQAYEEHFPGATDTEKLSEAVEGALKGTQKTFDEAMMEDPDAERSLRERLAKLAKIVQEFVEKLLAKLGFGPKP